MPSSRFLFLGFEINDEMRSLLTGGTEADSGFVLESGYLEKIRVDDNEYIGRRLSEGGVSLSNVEDSARNVMSLLTRGIPGWPGTSGDVLLLALEESSPHLDILMES